MMIPTSGRRQRVGCNCKLQWLCGGWRWFTWAAAFLLHVVNHADIQLDFPLNLHHCWKGGGGGGVQDWTEQYRMSLLWGKKTLLRRSTWSKGRGGRPNGIFSKRPSIHWVTGYFWLSALQYTGLLFFWNQFHVSKMRRPIFTLRSCSAEVPPSGQLCAAEVNPVTGELHGKFCV